MGLLDIMAERMNYTYLSDLRYLTRPNVALQRAVLDLPLTDFSQFEWIDAAEYLCGVKCKNGKGAKCIILYDFCK